jgi:hypothetical protein
VFRSDGEQADVIEVWALFDARVEKLVHRTVDQRDQMPVVLLAVVELVHRPARAELALLEQPGLLELRQHAVDGGKPQVEVQHQQLAVHVFGRQVAPVAVLEQLPAPSWLFLSNPACSNCAMNGSVG